MTSAQYVNPIAPVSSRQSAIAWAKGVMADPRTVFLDTETTSLGPEAEIVDVAIVDAAGTVLLDTLVKPVNSIPVDATKVHGIDDAMVADAPGWAEVWPLVVAAARTDQHVLCIYNAKYDLGVMDQCCRRHGLDPGALFVAECAMVRFAKFRGVRNRFGNGYRSHKLSVAAEHLGIPHPDAHRALADAEMTRRVVAAMAGVDA